jgi:hypothetical protein
VFEHRPGRHAIEALGFEIAFAGKALPDDSQLVRILGWRGLYARHRPPAIAHRCHEVASRRPDVERISGTTRDVRGLSRVAPRQATSVTSVTVIRAGVVTADLGDRWTRVEIAERTAPTLSDVPELVIDPEPIVTQPEENPCVVCSTEVAGHVLRHRTAFEVRPSSRATVSQRAAATTLCRTNRDTSLLRSSTRR